MPTDIQYFTRGFFVTLRLATSAERVAVVRALVEKNLMLGVAIDQKSLGHNPIPIAFSI